MRFRFTALLITVATFAAVPAAGQLQGGYRLTSINGQPLPAPSPTEAGVTLRRTYLVFAPDGTYTMQVRADTGKHYSAGSEGTWSIAGDTLVLSPEDEPKQGRARFRWSAQGSTLHLFDESGHDYAFAQGPAPRAEQLHGSYHVVQVDGQTLPYTARTENVTLREMEMALLPDGHYTLRMRADGGGETATREESGSYQVEGDRLTFKPDREAAGRSEFFWMVEGDTLVLVDETDVELTFARRDAR